ncbi:MAG: hypothetical protein KA243_01555 [Candidatus Aminicenantes bacterium]|nr:hypothetical protein [Candidatus Aminicenantes bacterium]
MKGRERKNEARDGFKAGAAGIQRELGRLAAAPVPPGLRERVLARASRERREAALPPWMRVVAAGCAALIVAFLVLDPIQSRQEQARLAALWNGRPVSAAVADTETELAEAGIGTEAALWSKYQRMAAAAALKPPDRASFEALERLKGWWEYEDPEDPY